MAKHAPVVEHAGNTVTAIAPTAEEAMALVGDAGPGYRTTSIGKVRRGGLAGFFATEMIRVVAEAPGMAPDHHAGPGRPTDPGRATGAGTPAALQLATADDLIASLCGADGPFAGRLAAGLQRSLDDPGPRAADSPRTLAAVTVAPETGPTIQPNFGVEDFWRSEPAEAGLGDRSPQRQQSPGNRAIDVADRDVTDRIAGAWSGPALEAVGLPAALVARVAGVGPYDEVTWNAALMLAARDWCGADLPTGAVLVGPACGPLAAALRAVVVVAADIAEREGPVAVPGACVADLAVEVGGRPVHLVVGGSWHHLSTVRPSIVSAATPTDLVDAVRAAVAWDAPLGWVHDGTAVVRIDPFLVAAHLRTLLAPDTRPVEQRTGTAGGRKGAATRRVTSPAAELPVSRSKSTATPAMANPQ